MEVGHHVYQGGVDAADPPGQGPGQLSGGVAGPLPAGGFQQIAHRLRLHQILSLIHIYLRESQVLVRTGARVERFYPDGVDYVLADGTEGSLRGYDSVVLAMGTRSREELRERIAAFVPQVLVVGEAASAPGHAVRATGDALDAALSI